MSTELIINTTEEILKMCGLFISDGIDVTIVLKAKKAMKEYAKQVALLAWEKCAESVVDNTFPTYEDSQCFTTWENVVADKESLITELSNQ